MKRPLLLFILFVLSRSVAWSQNSESYLNDVGNTAYGINIPVENGFINVSNGNLHLEFPFATHPQRGALSLRESLVYDSRIWMFSPFGTNGSYHWWPYNVVGSSTTSGGWRFIKGNEVGSISVSSGQVQNTSCWNGTYNAPYTIFTSSYTWTDPSGTVHPFPVTSTTQTIPANCTSGVQSGTFIGTGAGYATDASGYYATLTSSGGSVSMTVKDASGTQVYPSIVDRYGNFWSSDAQGNLIDDTGRTPVLVTTNGNTTYYDVLSPNGTIQNQGTRVRYTVVSASVPVATNFQQPDTYEWNPTTQYLTPVQSIQLPDGSQYTFQYDGYGELNQITLPTGGVIKYGYSNFLDSSSTENRWLSSRQVGSNPATSFTPYVGTTCVNYSSGCKEYVIMQKPSSDSVMYELTLANGAWNTGEYDYTGAIPVYSGKPPIGSSTVKPLLFTTTNYTYANPCSGSTCVGSNNITSALATTELFNSGSPTVYTQTQSMFDPASGKPTSTKTWDFAGIASMNLTTPPSSTPTRETDFTYVGFDTHQVTVLNSDGTQAAQTTYGYTTSATATASVSQHGTQNAGGPYLQTVSHWLNTGGSSTTTYTMDDTGMVRGVADANGNPASSSIYQCSNSLPYQSTNPIGQMTQYGYDCPSGAIQSIQDPNDLANSRTGTTYKYEAVMGRLYTQTDPDGGVTTYTYPSPNEVDTATTASPDPTIASVSISDAFGRPYQSITAGNEVDQTYDVNGRPYCTSNPYVQGSSTSGNTCTSSYDGLDRPLTQTQADQNTLQWTYSANVTNFTNEVGATWTQTVDAFSRLTSVVEPGALTTNYSYDGLGNVSKINQLGNVAGDIPRVRTFTYDSASRLICASQPEAATGACPLSATASIPSGTQSYTYYPAGNMHTATDARGTTTTYYYDGLNRPYQKTYSDSTPTVSLNYDQTGVWGAAQCGSGGFVQCNTIGRLSSVSTSAVSGLANSVVWSMFSYDAMGRMTLKSTCIAALCGNDRIDQYFTYDLAGNQTGYDHGTDIAKNSYYGGHALTYDNAARLQSLTYTPTAASTPSSLFTATKYSPTGLLESALGNGLSEVRSYDTRMRQQSYNVLTSAPSTAPSSLLGFVDVFENNDVVRFPNQSIPGTSLPENGTLFVGGWVGTAQSCPVAAVEVDIDSTAIGYATLGSSRPDVQSAIYNNDGKHAACGYNFTGSIGSTPVGQHSVSVVGIDASGNRAPLIMNNGNAITVTSDPPPSGYIDGMPSGTIVAGGLITLTGWAIDSQMHAPVGSVKILIDGQPVGYATLGISRPDVAAAAGDPRYTNSGWTFTQGIGSLGVGQHTVTGIVYDSGGQSAPLPQQGTFTVVADTQSASGSFDVAWNSANQTSILPMGGTLAAYGWAGEIGNTTACASSINRVDVLLDGNFLGTANVQSIQRSGVASTFNNPSCLNSGWQFTGPVSNVDAGVHTLTARAYDPSGGSTLLGTQTIQINAQLSPASITDMLPSQYSWSLGYEANGNIGYSYDSVNGEYSYLYDSLNRLTAAGSNSNGLQWNYDSFGNRTAQIVTSGSGVSQYQSFGLTATNRSDDLPYDAAGNSLSTGGAFPIPLTWDAEERVSSAGSTQYVYDAMGQRAAKYLNGALSEAYLYDNAGHVVTELNGSFQIDRREIYAGGHHVASVDQNGNLTYVLGDWLGTERARANSSGSLCQTTTSQPFGDNQATAGTCLPTPDFFTGLERDSESGLDHAMYRQYGSTNGRWMSPDPYNGSIDAGNPQSFNRYAYVGNMPLTNIDPTGLDGENPISAAGGMGGCIGAIYTEGASIPADIGCAISLYFDIKGLFFHPKLTASTTPRPNARIWDEHGGFHANPNEGIGDLLGLSGAGCEFGACGSGPSSFGPGGASGGSNPLEVTSGAVSGGFILPLFFGVLGPAGSFSYDPKNHLVCYGGGIGLSAGHTVGGGPVVVHAKPGNTSEDVLSGWSIGGGYNWTPWWGYQGSKGSSGYTAGYSFGVPGASGAITYSSCKHIGG